MTEIVPNSNTNIIRELSIVSIEIEIVLLTTITTVLVTLVVTIVSIEIVHSVSMVLSYVGPNF